MPENLIAVNLGSYGRYRENAPEHLRSIGIRHVEISVPPPDRAAAVAQQFREFGLSVSTMIAPCDLTKEAETFLPAAQTAREMGVPILFISAKAGEMPRAQAYARLRERAVIMVSRSRSRRTRISRRTPRQRAKRSPR
jgi:hypothetical protein